MQHLTTKIYGRVQGVGFRMSAQSMAIKLNITGFVKNEEDGTVYIEAEGEEENLKKFLEWCYKSPLTAKIDKTETEFTSELKCFSNFQIQ